MVVYCFWFTNNCTPPSLFSWAFSQILAILAILHLGLLRISPQHRYIVQTSIPSFSSFFPLLLNVFSKWNIDVFILVFSDPILFCLLLFLYNFLLSILRFYLSLNILNFLFLLLFLSLSVFYFLSCCLLSFSSDFLYLSSSTFSVSFFFFPSFIYFLSLPVFYYIPLTLLFIFPRMCVLLLSLPCSFLYFLPFSFCLPILLIFLHFSFSFVFLILFFFPTFFDYLVLILGFNYYKLSLLFIFYINLCYLFPFSLAVFFTKWEVFIFFTF